MVILRPTRKLHSSLPTVAATAPSDTALGDWYVNRIVVRRQPLLLLVSSTSLLPIVLPAREVRSLPRRLESVVSERLRRLGIEAELITAEVRAMRPVVTAATIDRSVLGIVVEFAKLIPHYRAANIDAHHELAGLEDWLQHTPCHASSTAEVVFPDLEAAALLGARWAPKQDRQPLADPPKPQV